MLAQLHGLVADLDLGAAGRLGELDLGRDRDVAALDRAAGAAAAHPEQVAERAAAAEERLEDVRDRAERLEVRRVPAAAQPLAAVAVVGRAALGVRQDLVRLGGLLELLLGVGVVAVDVGVKLASQAPERLLDRRLVGVARDAEDLVVVARCYSSLVVDLGDEARQLRRPPPGPHVIAWP